MATEIQKLAVLIEANTKSYERAMVRMQQQTEKAINASEKSVNKLSTAMDKANGSAGKFLKGFAAGAVAGGVAALGAMAKGAVSAAASIGDLSDRIGITTTSFQELQYGAVQANMSTEDLGEALMKMSRGMGDAANGQGKLLEAFNQLNISIYDQNGRLKTVDVALADFADGLLQVNNQQEKWNLIADVTGRASSDMVEFLGKGSAGMREFGAEAHKSGSILETEFIRKAQEIDDKWAAMTLTLGVYVKRFVLGAISDLNTLSDRIAKDSAIAQLLRGDVNLRNTLGTAGTSAGARGNVFPPPAPVSNAGSKQDLDTAALNQANAAAIRAKAQAIRDAAAAQKDAGEAAKYWGDQMQKVLDTSYEVSEQVSFFGNQAIDAFDSLTFGAEKLVDVVKNLAQAFLKAALQATLLGQGPLAGMFGTGSTSPNAGGIFGSLFGVQAKAGGGTMSAGKPYLVGENGPEMVLPGKQSYVVSNSRMGGGGGTQVHIHTPPGTTAETRSSQEGGGERLDVILRNAIKKELPGAMKPVMRDQYGISPAKRSRF